MSTTASLEKKKPFSKQASTSIKSKDRDREHIVVYLPANFPSCPPGLEKLIQADHLFVRQGIRLQEPPYTLISKQRFEVLNGRGERLFTARESSDNILKLCCRGGCGQPFEMSIKDKTSGYEILAVNGNPDCYGALTASVSQNGMTLGFLNEELRCCSSNYSLIDAQGNEIFRIYDVSSFRTKWNLESSTQKMHSKRNPTNTNPGPDTTSTTIFTCIKNTSSTTADNNITRNNDNNHKNPENTNNHNHQRGVNVPLGDSSSSSCVQTTSCNTFDDTVRTTSAITSEITTSAKPTATLMTTMTMSKTSPGSGSIITVSSTSIDTMIPTTSKSRTVTYSMDNDNGDDCLSGPSKSKPSEPSNQSRRPSTSKSKSCCNLGIGRCLDSCVSLISGGVEFDLYSCEMGVVVGKMGKQWGDLYDQYFNLVDCFGVNFPRDLSVRHKVLILGALFLLDFNHFQI